MVQNHLLLGSLDDVLLYTTFSHQSVDVYLEMEMYKRVYISEKNITLSFSRLCFFLKLRIENRDRRTI